jgi:hypothetical protein
VDGKKGSNSRRGCLTGMACGALVGLLFWLYFELKHPSSYSRLFALTYGPLLMLFGATAGFVFGAMRDRD